MAGPELQKSFLTSVFPEAPGKPTMAHAMALRKSYPSRYYVLQSSDLSFSAASAVDEDNAERRCYGPFHNIT